MAFALALLVALTNAPPAMNTGPIAVKSCAVGFIENGRILSSALRFTNGVTVTVMNTSSKPVTNYTIRGNYNGYKVVDNWSGTLAPGQTMTYMKHYQQQPFSGPTAQCKVTKATLADGTTWSAL